MTNPNRQPAGVPSGGQFAAGSTGESGLILENYPLDPHDTITAPVDELRGIDSDLAELHERGIKEDSRAVRALVEQRTQIIGDLTVDAEYVDLEDEGVAGKVIAYAKDGTIIFTDGSYSSVDGPILPCGHETRTPGCGGCDPGAVKSVIEDGGAVRPFDPHRDVSPDTSDIRVQAGEVFDHVVHPDWGTFHRRRDGVYPNYPYAMRFQADRPLTDDEVQHAAQLIGYNYAATVRGESVGTPERDSPYSFVVSADTTKSPSDDVGHALARFEDALPTMLGEGSPVRTTDRAGVGTAGTRLVDGFGTHTPKFEIFYDSVSETPYGDGGQGHDLLAEVRASLAGRRRIEGQAR